MLADCATLSSVRLLHKLCTLYLLNIQSSSFHVLQMSHLKQRNLLPCDSSWTVQPQTLSGSPFCWSCFGLRRQPRCGGTCSV